MNYEGLDCIAHTLVPVLNTTFGSHAVLPLISFFFVNEHHFGAWILLEWGRTTIVPAFLAKTKLIRSNDLSQD